MLYKEQIDMTRIPAHIAIIMDGNGRWAKQRGQARSFGHQAGAKSVHVIAEEAARRLQERYPGLRIAGTHDGYFKEDGPVVEEIRKSGADVVFVCLGAPKQEEWMARYGAMTGAHLLVGLGGSLDVFAGTVVRAPEGWQKLGLEWFYRLCREPWRWKRMIRLPLVLWYALLARLGGKKHG